MPNLTKFLILPCANAPIFAPVLRRSRFPGMDQRGERKMGGFLSSRKLSLRGATGKEKEDRKRRAEMDEKLKEQKEVIE